MSKHLEKGQGLVEYTLTLVFVLIIACVLVGGCWWLIAALLIPKWPEIKEWGTDLVIGIQTGDPTAIFIGITVIFLLWLIFRRK